LSRIEDGRLLGACQGSSLPLVAGDIDCLALAQQIAPVIEMRALQPRALVDFRSREYRVLNKDRKTVVRLYLDDMHVRAPGSRQRHSLPPALRLRAIRGYPGKLRDAQQTLTEQLPLTIVQDGHYHAALSVIGMQPGDYSSKLSLELEPDMTAHVATRQLLRSLLDTMRANLDGTRKDIDSEYLHDFRVALRRTRSALSQIKQVFAEDRTEYFKQQFAWLGSITGPTRDLDVFLLSYPDYRASLPTLLQDDLAPFHDFLVEHQRVEQAALRRRLSTRKFNDLLRDWEAFLDDDTLPDATNAARPVSELARQRIWKMYRRVVEEGRRIDDASPDEELHELRKSCKKLRYLIEFFTSLFPDEQLKPLVRKLKKLLDNLGEFNDISVQVDSIEYYAAQMIEEDSHTSRAIIVMGVLVGDLLRRHAEIRKQFNKQFAAFDTPATERDYRLLFKEKTR
jgi:CHAD domain-containing protein